MSSLKSKLRGRLMESRGARKNTKNNLWINYSLKLGKDIALASNNECWYWATALETDPSVRTFKFGCEAKVKYPWEDQFCRRDLIYVENSDNSTELHHLTASGGSTGPVTALVLGAHNETESEIIHLVTPQDVRALAPKALCWFQLLTFGNQIRNEILSAETDMLNLYMCSRIKGTVGALLNELDHRDSMVILGLLAREVVAGGVTIEFVHGCFGRHSVWSRRSSQ